MPVERFRSIEEMSAAPIRVVSGDAFERFIRHCRRYRLLAPKRYPPGVFRFRTLEEAQAARERASSEAMRTRG
jgi:hypothetical protein